MTAVKRKRTAHKKRAARVLLIRAGRLGDTIWATSAIDPVRRWFSSNVHIDLLVKRGMEGLFLHDPRIRRIFTIRHRSLPIILTPAKTRLLRHSRNEHYDLAIDLETGTDFIPLMKKISADQKLLARDVLTAEDTKQLHAVHCVRAVLSSCLPHDFVQDASPSLAASSGFAAARRFKIPSEYCIFHPGDSLIARGRKSFRSWPIEHWRTLIQLVTSGMSKSQKIIVIGEKKEKAHVSRIVSGFPHVLDICGYTSVPELMELIAKAKFVVSTDTGPSHLSAALQTPLVAIFGPTDPQRTGPWDPGTGLVKTLRATESEGQVVNPVRVMDSITAVSQVAP